MICACGVKLPLSNRYSICDSCLGRGKEGDPDDLDRWEDEMIHGRDDENEY